jgi:methyl-accepting chemotaxis protein
MKFKRSAPGVIGLAIVLMVTIVSVASYAISHRMLDSFEKTQFALMGSIVQSKFRDAENKALSMAEAIAVLPPVQSAFAEGNREQLLAIVKEPYAVLKNKYGIVASQFHKAPAVSFLRLHRPENHGDDQSGFRKIVAEVNQEQASRKGIEITNATVGIFGTTPVRNASGEMAGSYEVGLDIGPLLDELKKAYGFEVALFMNEQLLRDTGKLLKPEVFSDSNRVGSYIKFYSTHPDLLNSLVTDGDFMANDEVTYVRDSSGVPYGVLLQPVYSYSKKPIGVVAVAASFGETRSADGQALTWQVLLGLASVTLLFGVVAVVIRGLLLRPLGALTEHVSALSKPGDTAEPLSTDDWCDELKELNSECQRLAQRDSAHSRTQSSEA